MTIRLSQRELATVLAALRYWQQDLVDNERQGEGPISPDHFDDETTPLTADEIDGLCERLNLGPLSDWADLPSLPGTLLGPVPSSVPSPPPDCSPPARTARPAVGRLPPVPSFFKESRMRVLYINNDGGGFADYVEAEPGTTVAGFFAGRMPGRKAGDFLIRVNRLPATGDQALQEGDRVSITPTKIEGA